MGPEQSHITSAKLLERLGTPQRLSCTSNIALRRSQIDFNGVHGLLLEPTSEGDAFLLLSFFTSAAVSYSRGLVRIHGLQILRQESGEPAGIAVV